MAIRNFDDLDAFKRSYQAGIAIHHLTATFPKHELYSLGDQMRRASRSIFINIAEGYGKIKTSVNEFKRFLMIAHGSAEEMRVWLRFANDLSYIPKDEANKLEQEYSEIAKMIYALHRNWK
jgi:four helix bundle protein